MAENNDATLREINSAISVMSWGYYFWFAVYFLMVILTVGLPGLAAIITNDPETSRYLAGGGALAAAMTHALKPHEYATGFDAGLQLLWKTRVALITGAIDAINASSALSKAIDLTTFRYSPPSPPPN